MYRPAAIGHRQRIQPQSTAMFFLCHAAYAWTSSSSGLMLWQDIGVPFTLVRRPHYEIWEYC